MKIKAIIELIRAEHSLMLMLGVITVILFTNANPEFTQLMYLFISPFLISAGAFALNDYFDVESDRLNRKKRPIVMGRVSRQNALLIGIGSLVLGTLAAIPLGRDAFLVALLFAVLSIAYDYKLKDTVLIGNAVIASSMAIVFIFTEIALAGNVSTLIIFISAVSFLSGFGREIQKTSQDVKGDMKARKSKTLPMIIGKANALHIAAGLIALASIIALYLFAAVPPLQNNFGYLALALASIIGFAYSTKLFYGNEEEMEIGRKYSLYSLVMGVLAFLAGGV